MSKLFDHYYFGPDYKEQEARRIGDENAALELWELEHANQQTEEMPQRCVMEDGMVIEETTFK